MRSLRRRARRPRGSPKTCVPIPKNIYGVTKTAAEDLCRLFHRNEKLPCLILRTSRFFPEEDDVAERASAYEEMNLKVNELLYRRVDVEDVVTSHFLAMEKAPQLGFGKFIITATSPFQREDLAQLGVDAPSVVAQYYPEFPAIYARLGWKMLPVLDRVYINTRARGAGLASEIRLRHRAALRRGRPGLSQPDHPRHRREGLSSSGVIPLLDNIMWNCLSGPHAKFATGEGAIRRYAPGFSPIIGCEDPRSPDFETLAKYCEPGDCFYTDIWEGPVPAGWRLDRDARMWKMVWDAPMPADDAAPTRFRCDRNTPHKPWIWPGSPTPGLSASARRNSASTSAISMEATHRHGRRTPVRR